jgi:hypothetical protein
MTDGPITTSPDCLLVFVDDTGNESFSGSQPYFGLGGILIAAGEHERLLKPRWRQLRERITGSEDTPLHAADLGHSGKLEEIIAAADFFKENQFCRLGVTIGSEGNLPVALTRRQAVYEMLKNYVREAAMASRCDSVAFIFESSTRADAILKAEFGPFQATRNGTELPVEYCLMPKSAHDPGLEAADFVANAVGGMARRMIARRRDMGADFCSLFHSVPDNIARFIHIDHVVSGNPSPMVSGFGLSPIR